MHNDFVSTDNYSGFSGVTKSAKHIAILNSKFTKLSRQHSNKSPNFSKFNQNAVVNFSSAFLSQDEIHYFKLNDIFAFSSKLSLSNMIASIERALKFSALNHSQMNSVKHISYTSGI